MAALSRRDIEMIFRADTDKAVRPIADLGKAVKTARGQLEEMIDAAGKGEVSLDKLGQTTRDLKKAQDELGTARSLLTQLNAQEAALEKAQARATETAAKYAELKAAVDGAAQPTKRLVNSMEAAGRASNAAAENLDRVQKEAADTRDRIEGIIGPVANTAEAFRTIANTSQEIARGLAVAGNAADDFQAKIAAAAKTKLDDQAFGAMADKSPLLQEQINYISQFENRVEMLRAAEASLASQQREAASADLLAKARQRAAIDDVLAGNKALEAEIEAVAAASAQAERVAAFQNVAQQAKAGLADVERFGVAEDAVAASTERLAQSLGALLNPSAAANRSIDSIEASVVEAAKVLEGGKKSATDYGNALNELSSAAAGIVSVAGRVDAFKAQQAAVDASTKKFEEARTEALALATALETPGDNAEDLARKLKAAEGSVETAGNAMQREKQKLVELSAALKRAGIDVNDLAAAEKRLTDAAKEVGDASADIRKQTGGGIGGFLGLNPQDATNLSYQLNDIFTQLASGQSIFVTLAQQGPQIWQIQGVKAYASSLSGLLIPLAAVAAGVGVVVGAFILLNKATHDSQELMNAKGYLASLGEASTLTAKQLVDGADKLESFGLKAEDANKIVRAFGEDGLNPSYLEEYSVAVKNAAEVTGTDMPAAAEALSTALKGGYDQVVALNETYPVLTDAELAQIQAMYDSGKADEARQLIFDRFTQKYADAADKMNGPWSNAWDNLKAAAERFGKYIGSTLSSYLSGLRKDLDDVAVGVNYVLLRMRGLNAEQAGRIAVQQNGRVQPKQGNGTIKPREASTAAGKAAADDAEREAKAKGKTAKLEDKIALARLKARRDAQKNGYGTQDEQRLMDIAEQDVRRAQSEKDAAASARAAKKAQSARDKAAREAEALANKIKSQSDALESALDAMGAKVAKVSAGTLQEQLANAADAVEKQYSATLRKLADYSQLTGGKGKIGDLTIAQYKAQVEANKTILAQQAQLKVYEDNVNDTLAERKQLLADIEDKANRGEITGADAIQQAQEVTSKYEPLIANITGAAIKFAQSIGGAQPSAELKAFVAKMQGIQGRNTGDNQSDVRKAAESNVGRGEAALNKILSERNSLVESYNTLVELGLMSTGDAQKASAEAYNQSAGAIQTQITALRAMYAEAQKFRVYSPQFMAAFEARMKAIGAQTQYLNPQFAQLKQGVDQIVTQNAVTAIDQLAQAFAGWATGTMSLGDAFSAALNAFGQFIAQTLIGIGKLIVQMAILDLVQKTTGIPVAALLQLQAGTQGNYGQNASGGLFGFLGKLFHGGGTVGQAGGMSTTRISISPAAIAAAPRYHDGAPAVGLKPNEQVAVLERGEKVMTEEQQRQEAAAKARQSGGRGLRQVLAFGDDQVAAAMSGTAGEDVTLTHIRRNIPLIKQMVEN